jgi:hypothetical protein
MNHSVCVFTVVRGDSVIRRICSVDVASSDAQKHISCMFDVCFREHDGECNCTAAESDSSLKYKYKFNRFAVDSSVAADKPSCDVPS